jgi:hypothetical protein
MESVDLGALVQEELGLSIPMELVVYYGVLAKWGSVYSWTVAACTGHEWAMNDSGGDR